MPAVQAASVLFCFSHFLPGQHPDFNALSRVPEEQYDRDLPGICWLTEPSGLLTPCLTTVPIPNLGLAVTGLAQAQPSCPSGKQESHQLRLRFLMDS